MLEELPSESQAAQILLGDLTGDLQERIYRLRLLMALDCDLGGSSVMLPGGHACYWGYTEARASFVAGNFLATILLTQGMLENLLGGHLVMDDVSREIKNAPPRASRPFGGRPALNDLLTHAVEAGTLTDADVRKIRRLMSIRNPLIHFRNVNDPENIERRAINSGMHASHIMFEDARFAISTIISILSKPEFAIGRAKEAGA